MPSGAHKSPVSAQNALVRQPTAHPDGWGLGWFHDDEAYVVKTASAAFDCARFRRVSGGLTSHTSLADLRRATVGQLDHLNAHPFRHGRWLLAHDGAIIVLESDLWEWLLDGVAPDRRPLIVGETDSELLFHRLLTLIEARGGDPTERIGADEIVWEDVVDGSTLMVDAGFALTIWGPPPDWQAPGLPERFRILPTGS